MTPATSNASCGQFMMGHYWWGGDLSYQETTSGVLCWWASTSHDDVAHYQLYTLASWDCQERTKVLHREGKLGSAQSGHKRASRRRSRSSSRCCSRTPALRDWSGHSCCSPPNTPPRCHCGEPLSLGADTMPKLTSAVNVLAYAQSSRSSRGMARASLDDEDTWEDDFQTPHMLVCHIVWRHGGGHRELATERMETSGGGNPGW